MMLGGGLVMVMGLLFLLAIVFIPILLVFVVVVGTTGFLQKRNEASVIYQNPINAPRSPIVQSSRVEAEPTRKCSHCGAGLQAGWTHCPQCGSPIG